MLAKLPATSPKNLRTVSLAELIERVYLPNVKASVRASTYNEYVAMFSRHIKGRAIKPVRHYDTAATQDLLDSIAEDNAGKMSIATLRHIRALLSGIFRFAKKKGLYGEENPVRDCTLMAGMKAPKQTHAYTLEEVTAVINDLADDPESQTIVAVAAYTGLRRNELAGLRWMDWEGDALHVRQSVFNHVVNEPKSAASKLWVPEVRGALELFKAYREAGDEFGLMTPDLRIFRVELDHTGRMHIAAAFARAGYKWRGYHAFRRGVATNLHESGVSDITIMRALRHSSLAVTVDSYVKIRDGMLEPAMKKLSNQDGSRLNGDGK